MKAAFATWNDRIAPVFDVARQIHIVQSHSGRIIEEASVGLVEEIPMQKALRLSALGINTLVCGAISQPMQALISAYGIQVIPFVAGDLAEVIQAWLNGEIEHARFAMPGCCGQGRRRFKGAHGGTSKEENPMSGADRGGMGQGGGQGRVGRGRGRKGGPLAGGAVGTCKCPKCGHSVAHERGVPCTQKQCPKCGTAMTRE